MTMDRKQRIIREAIRLFAERGVDATTTLKIAEAAEVTEPLVFYYFKNKDGLFAEIVRIIFTEYFNRFDSLKLRPGREFHNIRQLVEMHLDLIEEMPAESYLVVSSCPGNLRDSMHICTQKIREQRQRLFTYITGCIERGIRRGEFFNVPVPETTRLMVAFLNGIVRHESQSIVALADEGAAGYEDIKTIALAFCRRCLVKSL